WYYKAYFYPDYIKSVKSRLKPMKSFPTVAVAVPVFNEDPKIVAKTFAKLSKLNYPAGKIKYYMLDDSSKSEIAEEMRKIAIENGAIYLHRDNRRGYKAGALNDMLKVSKEEFVAIFDADEYLTNRNFLLETLPYFQDENLSYLQTEKRSAKGNFFSDSVDLFNAFFFKFIQTARALNNTAIFAGSCGVIRRSSLDKIGGFPEYVIEDTFFSFESDENAFKSLYLPKVYALGRPIKSFTALSKQQWRYNYGDTQFLGYFLKKIRRGKKIRKFTTLSSVDYIAHGFGLNYLSLILIIFTFVSVLIVFSAFPMKYFTLGEFLSVKNITFDLEVFGIIAFTLSLFIPVILTKFYFKSVSKGVMIFLLNFALAFVRTKAAIAALLRKDPKQQWQKVFPKNQSMISALYNTRFEISFASLLFVLGYISIFVKSNFFGGLWLMWYGALYAIATIFFYKYR
ncbi:MAG: glycosyltransferase, partial [Candidatus Micrarchaeia archaeon]